MQNPSFQYYEAHDETIQLNIISVLATIGSRGLLIMFRNRVTFDMKLMK